MKRCGFQIPKPKKVLRVRYSFDSNGKLVRTKRLGTYYIYPESLLRIYKACVSCPHNRVNPAGHHRFCAKGDPDFYFRYYRIPYDPHILIENTPYYIELAQRVSSGGPLNLNPKYGGLSDPSGPCGKEKRSLDFREKADGSEDRLGDGGKIATGELSPAGQNSR